MTVWKPRPRWQPLSHFLQHTHGPLKSSSPQLILVHLPVAPSASSSSSSDLPAAIALQAFDLLCWTINMAARPRDTVIALRQDTLPENSAQSLNALFQPLRALCDMKEVRLEMRTSAADCIDTMLVDQVSSLGATMLVVTTLAPNSPRHARRKGSFLCKQLPSGCSVVVVKDYKVVFYKRNDSWAAPAQKPCMPSERDGALLIQTTELASDGMGNGQHNVSTLYNHSTQSETGSPKRVLDGLDVFYESDDGHDSGEQIGLSRSLSKKYLIVHRTSSSHCGDELVYFKQPHGCLSIWRDSPHVWRSFSFPSSAARQLKRMLIFHHCKSFRHSLQSFMSSFRITRPLQTINRNTTHIVSPRSLKTFTLEEISEATNSFSHRNLVGKGGHSEVYKGLFPGGQCIAVKRLIQSDSGEQKIIDFLTELGIICHTSHPNIIRIIGFCVENGFHLVFDFLEHGSLASWLHGGKRLKWSIRYRVAVGTARGLHYLHSDCPRRIIHRDVKASNILLGPDFEPQVSDFGLAKWLPNRCSHHVTMPIEGTFGYLAPEYFMHGILDEKTDVFAFGVLLLELITGRKPIEDDLQPNLVAWARPFLEAMNVQGLADVHLDGDYDPQEMQCMMIAAALCVQPSPQCRPSMAQVLQLLTDETGQDSLSSSQPLHLDALFDDEYSSTRYRSDLRRHREIALQF